MPNHTPTQIIQTAQQCALAQRAQQAHRLKRLKRWKWVAFAVALFPPLLSLILAWQRTGELPTLLLVWLAVMVFMTVFGWLRTPR